MTSALASALDRFRRVTLGRRFVAPEEEAYRRLATKGFRPAALIDVGAYHGEWTRLARQVFGSIPGLMVEAQPAKAVALTRLCEQGDGLRFVSAVLGPTTGEQVTFHQMETGSSLMPERSNVDRVPVMLMTRTLDEIASDFAGPLFLKIDVQGAELEVLRGGPETLARSDLVQLEIALLPYNEGAPTFLEVIEYMDERSFVPYDIAGFSRPTGSDLAQIDVLFVRQDSALRTRLFEF